MLQYKHNLAFFQIEELPMSIGSLKNLEELVVSQNFLEHLPPSIGLCRKLHTLNVDDNDLVIFYNSIFLTLRQSNAIAMSSYWQQSEKNANWTSFRGNEHITKGWQSFVNILICQTNKASAYDKLWG